VPGFPQVSRLDAARVLAELARLTGTALAFDGSCRGGQVGAAYVRWPDGHRSVLTCQPAGNGAAARQAGQLTEAARRAGVPAPRYELIAELPSAVAIVQELLPGSVPDRMSRRTLESMTELNRRCRGLLAGRADLPPPPLYLLTDGPGFCLHQPMAGYSRRTARLLAAVTEIGAAVPASLAGTDLVHFDFHPGNILTSRHGTVTGVVDWDGANRGNGHLDLVLLRFDLARWHPRLGRELDPLLAGRVPDEVARACWAHVSLRLVDWSIREHTDADVTAWLDVAERLAPR
jgi:Phosphotransferase enzyme family